LPGRNGRRYPVALLEKRVEQQFLSLKRTAQFIAPVAYCFQAFTKGLRRSDRWVARSRIR
jgi:hypothetical protein